MALFPDNYSKMHLGDQIVAIVHCAGYWLKRGKIEIAMGLRTEYRRRIKEAAEGMVATTEWEDLAERREVYLRTMVTARDRHSRFATDHWTIGDMEMWRWSAGLATMYQDRIDTATQHALKEG